MNKYLILSVFFLFALTAFTPGVNAQSSTKGGGNVQQGTTDAVGTPTTATDQTATKSGAQAAAPSAEPSPGAPAASGGFVPLVKIPGLTDQQPTNSFAPFLNNLYKFLIGIAAAIAVIQIVRGGINIATQDSAEKHGAGREQIEQALIGLALVLSPVLVFSIINPGILDLNINMQPLNLSQYKGLTFGGGAAQIQKILDCNGKDCTFAMSQCKNMTTSDSLAPQVFCQNNNSGGSNYPEYGPPNDAMCQNGYTPKVKCSGTANTNGAGDAGLTSNDTTAAAYFDGQYMDLVGFIGPTASAQADAYNCQTASQKKNPIPAGADAVYVACVTPSIDYLAYNYLSESTDKLYKLGPATTKLYNTFVGECKALQSSLSTQGLKYYTSSEDTHASSNTPCTPDEKAVFVSTDPNPNSSCYKTTTTCSLTQ